MASSNLRTLIEAFGRQTIVGIGDLILDQYRRGRAIGLSPEAPAIDLLNPGLIETPGGAANVAWNIGHLGGHVAMIGVVGKDTEAATLQRLFAATPGVEYVPVEDATRPTTLKLRFYHEQFQVLRVNQESREPVSAEIAQRCIDALRARAPQASAVFVEDYGKGLVGPELVDALREVHRMLPTLPILLDPKVGNHAVYQSEMCTIIKPNWKEACQLVGAESDRADRMEVARMLSERYACDVVITLGREGAVVYERSAGSGTIVPTQAREAFDVAGAGDTTLAALTLALAAGGSLVEATELANLAGGLVIEKSGTAYVTVEELTRELSV